VKAKRKFTVVIERDEDGWYAATVPALRGCHTQAKNLDTLMKRIREAIALCRGAGEKAGRLVARKRRVMVEAKKLNPREERALAEEGIN
jgi:predicted RNase H-like HicB family nuclease